MAESAPGSRASLSRRGSSSSTSNLFHVADRLGGNAVHAYGTLSSTLKQSGAGSFAKASRDCKPLRPGYPVEKTSAALCPVHSYKMLSTYQPKAPASFGNAIARPQAAAADRMRPHAYADPTSTLSRAGATAFSQELKSGQPPWDKCLVHAYAEAKSTLRQQGATAFSQEQKSSSSAAACPVHSYSTLHNHVKNAPATFGRAPARPGSAGASAVHAYASQSSTLRPTSAHFGTSASRAELTSTLPLSRMGLMSTLRSSSSTVSLQQAYNRRPTTAPAGGTRTTRGKPMQRCRQTLSRPPSAASYCKAIENTAGALPPTVPGELSATRLKIHRDNGTHAEVLILNSSNASTPRDVDRSTDASNGRKIAPSLTIEPPPTSLAYAAKEAQRVVGALEGKLLLDDEASPTSVTASPMPRGRGLRDGMQSSIALASPAA
jgi:hypothetical protein